MTPGPGIEPGTHWWEASALTTAPTLRKLEKPDRWSSFSKERLTSYTADDMIDDKGNLSVVVQSCQILSGFL